MQKQKWGNDDLINDFAVPSTLPHICDEIKMKSSAHILEEKTETTGYTLKRKQPAAGKVEGTKASTTRGQQYIVAGTSPSQ